MIESLLWTSRGSACISIVKGRAVRIEVSPALGLKLFRTTGQEQIAGHTAWVVKMQATRDCGPETMFEARSLLAVLISNVRRDGSASK